MAMAASQSHPCSPDKHPRMTLHYDISSNLVTAGVLALEAPKKLKRTPHIFCRVLELPCSSETPVDISDLRDRYVFVIQQAGLMADKVEVEVIEILPGATKIVVGGSDGIRLALEELEVELLRFRLPPPTLPEASTAIYQDGVLTVTVPKSDVRLEKILGETGQDKHDSAREQRQSDAVPRSNGRSDQGLTTGSVCDSKGDTVPDGRIQTTRDTWIEEKVPKKAVLPPVEALISNLDQKRSCIPRFPEASAQASLERPFRKKILGEIKNSVIVVQ